MLLRQIFDPYLAQYAYLIGCQKTGQALIIDPERDIAQYQSLAAQNNLRITAVAETHIHADFVSGARELATDPDIQVYVSAEGGPDWTYKWTAGRANSTLLRHNDTFRIGGIEVRAIHSPGHTPEHLSYLITDLGGGADSPIALATGDFVFVGDVGRPDLLESAAGMRGVMEPSARTLQASLTQQLANLEDFLQILPGHGAGSACGKALGAVPTSTLGYERRFNRPLRQAAADPEGFVHEILRGQPEPPPYFAIMKRVNRDGIRVTGGVPSVPSLSPSEARSQIDKQPCVILDARQSADAFAADHLPGAIHVPLRTPFFSSGSGSYLAEGDSVLLAVESEADALLAATQLYRIGFDKIVGWVAPSAWAASGMEMAQSVRVQFSEFDTATARKGGVILDVRTSAEFAEGHIDGALSIPYTRLRTRIEEVPKGRPIHVHCGSGKRAALATSFLRSRNFDAIHIDGVCKECERIAVSQGVTH